jgi:hypothetical protein
MISAKRWLAECVFFFGGGVVRVHDAEPALVWVVGEDVSGSVDVVYGVGVLDSQELVLEECVVAGDIFGFLWLSYIDFI